MRSLTAGFDFFIFRLTAVLLAPPAAFFFEGVLIMGSARLYIAAKR
jgi:hypothetical protein